MNSPMDSSGVEPAIRTVRVLLPASPWWQSTFWAGLIGAVVGGAIAAATQAWVLARESKSRARLARAILMHGLARRLALAERAVKMIEKAPASALAAVQPLIDLGTGAEGDDEHLGRLPTIKLATRVREWNTRVWRQALLARASIERQSSGFGKSDETTPAPDTHQDLARMLQVSVRRGSRVMGALGVSGVRRLPIKIRRLTPSRLLDWLRDRGQRAIAREK
jgi:hypothetical protein